MKRHANRYPGLNLSNAHGSDHDVAESLIFGFWVFLMSDAILFALVFASYITSSTARAGGPGPHQLFDLGSTFVQTLLLLASSLTFGFASLALKYRRRTGILLGWLTITLVLGIIFLTLEFRDFSKMLAMGGVPSRSGYLSAFFGLVPLHGLHVLSGCIWLICLMGQIGRYGVDTSTKLGIMRLALFWHFLDIIWIAIFSVVYLAGLT